MEHAFISTESPVGYAELERRITSLIATDDDLISVMANVSAALHQNFGWHWVGFYRVVGNELLLGPFQGPVACSRIAHGQGVCGSAWASGKTYLVPDVEAFPGHIACSPDSKSELVIPIKDATGTVIAVLDVDSSVLNGLSEDDARGLERIVALLSAKLG